MRTAAALASLAALLVSRSPEAAATAKPGPRPPTGSAFVALDLDGCAVAPAAEIREIVATELRSSMALLEGAEGDAGNPAAGVTAIRVICDGSGAEIAIRDPITSKSLSRALDLRTTPTVARGHLIALSVVELLFASWGELLTNPKPVAAPLGPPPPAEARAAALAFVREQAPPPGRPPVDLTISASLAISSFGLGRTASLGPRLHGGAIVFSWDGPRHLGLLGDLSFQRGSGEYSLGLVSADSLNGLAALVGSPSFGRVILRAGVGARGGVAWLSGAPRDPATAFGGAVRGIWWGPAAIAVGGARLGRRVVAALTFEIGHALLSVTARVQGETPMVIGGTWWRGTVGVGLAL